MGRFNVVKELVETFVTLTGIQLQAWMAPAFFLVVGILLFPAIRRTHRTGRARKRLRLIAYRRLDERQRLEDEALSLVRGNPSGQLAIAQEALRLGRKDLARKVLDGMEPRRRHQAEVLRLQRQLEEPGAHSALEAQAAIDRLIEAGLYAEARRRQVLAERRWPGVDRWPAIPDGPDTPPVETP